MHKRWYYSCIKDKGVKNILNDYCLRGIGLSSAGTGTVGAVKYKNVTSYANTDKIPEDIIVRSFLEKEIKENYPNVNIKVNKEKPVWSTIRYVKSKIYDGKGKQTEEVEK